VRWGRNGTKGAEEDESQVEQGSARLKLWRGKSAERERDLIETTGEMLSTSHGARAREDGGRFLIGRIPEKTRTDVGHDGTPGGNTMGGEVLT